MDTFKGQDNHLSISVREEVELSYPEEQLSLIIMDTFKGQDNHLSISVREKLNLVTQRSSCPLSLWIHLKGKTIIFPYQ